MIDAYKVAFIDNSKFNFIENETLCEMSSDILEKIFMCCLLISFLKGKRSLSEVNSTLIWPNLARKCSL